jgi:Circularly permutated YpsA SLOG family
MEGTNLPINVKIITGGQTGVDTGAMRAAVALGVQSRAYFPRGFKREEPLLPAYQWLRDLGECIKSDSYSARTLHTVSKANAVLVIPGPESTPGTDKTITLAREANVPLWVMRYTADPAYLRAESHAVAYWRAQMGRKDVTLMVAGPRGSKWRAGEAMALAVVTALLTELKELR